MHPVSQSLQQVGADIVSALQQIDDLVSVLCEWRTNVESKFADLYTKAEKLGEALEVTLVPPRVVKRSQYRSNVGNCQNAADYYRVNVYVPLLDTVVSDIESRFSAHQRQSFALAGLIPSQLKDWDTVKAAVEKYTDSLDSVSLVEGEYHRWSQYWSTATDKMKHSTAISALNVCPAMFYPNINSLLRILATLPSTPQNQNVCSAR
jgi:hypothetical protein